VKYLALWKISCSITVLISLAAAAHAQSSTSFESDRDLLRTGGLRAVAEKHGHYIAHVQFNQWELYNLELLTSQSDLILEAKPTLVDMKLSPDGTSIYSSFMLKPSEIFKRSASAQAENTLIVPGGKVTFQDGTWAEIDTPLQSALASGKSFLLFLKKGEDGLHVLGLDQGVIAIDTERASVASMGRAIDPITDELKGMSPGDVRERVRRLVSSQ
jgi:hypothetical protein